MPLFVRLLIAASLHGLSRRDEKKTAQTTSSTRLPILHAVSHPSADVEQGHAVARKVTPAPVEHHRSH